MVLSRLFKPPRHQNGASALYVAVVEQARNPFFFTEGGVPDSLDGRFDAILLHVYLILRRLRGGGAEWRDFAQNFHDVFFQDMDRSLREIGVYDMVVGKRIKKMAQALYGRIDIYDRALESTDDAVLSEAMRRNLYGTVADRVDAFAVAKVADYLRSADRRLAETALPLDPDHLPWPNLIP